MLAAPTAPRPGSVGDAVVLHGLGDGRVDSCSPVTHRFDAVATETVNAELGDAMPTSRASRPALYYLLPSV